MKAANTRQNKREGPQKQTAPVNNGKLKTDSPLSEKDEVKQAEEKMRKAVKPRSS